VIDTSLNANDSGTQTNVVGIVVGSVIGGIVLIAAVVAGSCVYYKHKKKE
jgi:Ca2+/Na+ antiporter